MRFSFHLLIIGLLAAMLLTAGFWDVPTDAKMPACRKSALRLEEKNLPQGKLYAVTIPADAGYRVTPAIRKNLAGVESPVWREMEADDGPPVFIINGGFFDPKNSLTTSYVFKNGILIGDPTTNPNLTGNPKLKPYLPRIFNRSEFRVYQCQADDGTFQTHYDIANRDGKPLDGCLLQDALGGGPALLPTVSGFVEGFIDYGEQGKVIRDPIGVASPNARSAVGLTENGDVIVLMGAQVPGSPTPTGFTLAEMASLLKERGAVKALALDGGSSSSLVFQGKPYYGKFSKDGLPVKRPVKSVLMVIPQ